MKLSVTFLGLAHGLCDNDPCVHAASQNGWNISEYTQCTKDFVKQSNVTKKTFLRQASRNRRSAHTVDNSCPVMQCSEIHNLSDTASIKAYRKCANQNKKNMPPTNSFEPHTIHDSCNNYSEAWGECSCWNNEHVGCSYNLPGFARFPDEPHQMGTKFLLITNNDAPLNDQKILAEPGVGNDFDISQFGTFVAGQRTILCIHGFGQDQIWTCELLAKAIKMKNTKWNVINVEWIEAADPSQNGNWWDFDITGTYSLKEDYSKASSNTRVVGRQIANFLSSMITARLVEPSKIHLVGHSMGGHVVGYAGKWFNRMYDEKIGRISSLDPAGLIFEYKNYIPNYFSYPLCALPTWMGGQNCKWALTETEQRRNRIDWTDGAFVDVIHTAGWGITGTMEAWGHADYYPNGGDLPFYLFGETCYRIENVSKEDDDTQDGDGLKWMDSVALHDFVGDCPHRYALEFFLASVHNKCYKTLQCSSYEDYQNGNCHSKKKYQMGFWAKQQLLNDNNRQKYYMDTELDCTKN